MSKSLIKTHDRQQTNDDLLRRLLRVEANLEGTQLAIDAYRELQLKDDIETEMDDVLRGYQFTGVLEAHAAEQYENKETELDEFWGDQDEYAREMEVMPKATDARVKAYIYRNPEYVRRKKNLALIKRKWNVLKHLNRAFYMKYELIRTKSANVRREQGDLGAAPKKTRRYPRTDKNRSGENNGS
jgi:hypothetical protein